MLQEVKELINTLDQLLHGGFIQGLDNLLFIFMRYLEENETRRVTGQVFTVIRQCKDYANHGNWTMAKIIWLGKLCNFKLGPKGSNSVWNVYGSEYNIFVRHLEEIQGFDFDFNIALRHIGSHGPFQCLNNIV